MRWSVRLCASAIASVALLVSPVMIGAASVAAQEDPELEALEVLATETGEDGRVRVEIAAPRSLEDTDLPPEAFRLTQEGVDRPISLQRLAADDLDVVLAIDVSGSMAGPPMNAAVEAANSFLRRAPSGARVSVVTFGSTSEVIQPLSADFGDVATALAGLTPDGETALYDGLSVALDQFPLARTSRRTVILLSDGEDTVSELDLAAIESEVEGTGVDLYAVALGGAQTDVLAALVDVADGGRLATAGSEQLGTVYDEIGRVLANQYRLVFTPATSVGSEGQVFVDHLGVRAVGDFRFDPPARAAGSSAAAPLAEDVDRPLPVPQYSVVASSWLANESVRIAALVVLGLAMFLIGLLFFNSAPRALQIASDHAARATPQRSLETAIGRATGLADRVLERRDRGKVVGLALERAGSALRPSEFVALVFVAAVAVLAILTLLTNIWFGAFGAAVVLFGSRGWLTARGQRRSRAFTEQLGETVQLLAGSLRAGHALPQALDAVARESAVPTADEFHRVTAELRLGRDLGQSLEAARQRVQSQDFDWVVRAIDIHRELGGDLAEVLDNIGETIRDRGFIRRQFKALSAEGRYSAVLLLALPFIVIAALLVISPGYITPLFADSRGQIMLMIAGGSMAIGALWLRQMLKVRF